VAKPLDPIPPRRLEYHAPQLLSCPATQYPESLKRRAIGGHVVLELVVDTLGRVPRDRIVVRETPHPGLAQAAITMAAGCRFVPARVRSEERRVGKEGGARRWAGDTKKIEVISDVVHART